MHNIYPHDKNSFNIKEEIVSEDFLRIIESEVISRESDLNANSWDVIN